MSLSHREEEIVKIITPIALEAVENDARDRGESLTEKEKAKAVAETMDDMVAELDGQQLNVPCDGGFCEICGMCAF